MNLVSLRQKLVASNIANADTPGYKTQDLDFQASFRSALDGGSPEAVHVTGLKTKNDGNNVGLDCRPLRLPGLRQRPCPRARRGSDRLRSSPTNRNEPGK